MNAILRKQIHNSLRNYLSKSICTSSKLNGIGSGAYEGEGKTTVHVMNNDLQDGLMIDGYSQVGFRLNNNITILGSMVIFRRSVLSWQVEDVSDLNEEAFSLFSVLEPKIDILVLGIGDQVKNRDFYQKLLPFSRQYKIPFEILPTEQACTTFNFLNSEGRNVAGAMIPPTIFQATDDDEFRTKMRYQDIYGTDLRIVGL